MDFNEQAPRSANSPKPSRCTRRRLLAGIGAGGGAVAAVGVLPARWTKPLVDSVMLPAHAQTTTGVDPQPGPACPDLPPSQTITSSDGVFGLGQGNTATVYIDPDAQTISLTNGGPALSGQLPALEITDIGDEFETSGGSGFSLVSAIDRSPNTTGPGQYTVTATVEHADTCSRYDIVVQVEIEPTGAVNVDDLEVTGPNPI